MDRQYNGRVRVTYVDVDDQRMDSYPKVLEMIQERQVSLPLLMVDGRVLPEAPVAWRTIVNEVRARGIKEVV